MIFLNVDVMVLMFFGCLIPMLARGLGLNLGYAKNEADSGSRYHSLVFCPCKNNLFFLVCLLFFLSMTLLLSFSNLINSSSHHLSKPCFCFSSESMLDPFFSRSQSRELEDEIFSMAQKRLCDTYSDACGLALRRRTC